jgi:hypothetical protein
MSHPIIELMNKLVDGLFLLESVKEDKKLLDELRKIAQQLNKIFVSVLEK